MGADVTALCVCTVWALVTRVIRPVPLIEAGVVSICAFVGVPDDAGGLAAAFTFVLCHVGLCGSHGVPGSFMFCVTLAVVGAQSNLANTITAYGGGLLLAVAVCGVACLAFGRQSSMRRRLRMVDRRVERLTRYVPVRYLGSRLDDPVAACSLERIWLAAVFVDPEGFTHVVTRSALGDVEALVQSFVTQTTRVARQHDGVVMKLLGDGALIVFPQADGQIHEAVAKAAIRFATRIAGCRFGSAGFHDHGLAARVGVAVGECSLGDWGEADMLDYTVIGPPINLPSRLQSAAPSGGVLMCEATARLIGTTRSTRDPVSLWLPGLGAVTAVRVAGGDSVC